MAILCRKLKAVKHALVDLNKAHGNVHSNVKLARVALTDFQNNMVAPTSTDMLATEADLIVKLNTALIEEESLLLQKSRVKWLAKGDGNNGFFYNQCKLNWNHNKVLAIFDNSGTLVHGQRQCATVAVDYYTDFLGAMETSNTDFSSMDDIVCPTITEAQANVLESTVSRELIYATLKKMGKNKAPGPDGFNVEFFIATWNIVGDCFCDAVLSLFNDLNMHNGINSTNIALITKVTTPAHMRDFRPISLCTIAYKCI